MLSLFLPYLGYAQKVDSLDQYLLKEVAVKGFTSDRELVDHSAAISTLMPQNLEQLSVQDPVMAWNSLPGVILEQRAIGSYRINIRGSAMRAPFGVRDVKVYWNNIPFTEANGTTALNTLSLLQMRSFQVIKGPAGSMYGAGLGGVVHLATPYQNLSKLELGLSAGSFGARQFSLQGAFGETHYAITHDQSSGYRDHNALNRQVYQLSHRFHWNDDHQLKVHALLSDLKYEIPGGLTEEQYQNDPIQARAGSADQNSSIDQQNLLIGLDYESFISSQLSQATQLGFSYVDFENPFILDYKADENREWSLRSQWTYTHNLNALEFRWDAGLEWQLADNTAANYGNVMGMKDTLNFKDELRIDRKTFFLQSDINWQKWTATLGLSSNLLLYEIDRLYDANASPSFLSKTFNNELIPRFSLRYNWSRRASTFFSVSEGFSSPTLDEIRTNEGSINEQLEAERGISYELGYTLQQEKIQLQSSLFRSQLKETITTYTNADGVVLFQNSGETEQWGFELALDNLWLKNLNAQLLNEISTRSSLHYYDFTFVDYQKRDNDYSGNQIPGVPMSRLSQVLSVGLFKHFHLNAQYIFQDKVYLNDANTIQANPFHLLNFYLNYEIPIRKTVLGIQFSIENVANISYSLGNDLNPFGGRYYQPAPARNWHIGLTWKL